MNIYTKVLTLTASAFAACGLVITAVGTAINGEFPNILPQLNVNIESKGGLREQPDSRFGSEDNRSERSYDRGDSSERDYYGRSYGERSHGYMDDFYSDFFGYDYNDIFGGFFDNDFSSFFGDDFDNHPDSSGSVEYF